MAAENTKPTDVGITEAFVIHWCIHETGGDSNGNNMTLDIEYSDDQSTWYTLGSQGATDKKFRWDNNPNLTEHEATTVKLSSGVAEKVHEAACVDFDAIAGSHDEMSICLEGYNPAESTTYYFRAKIDGSYPPLEDPPNTYPQIETGLAPEISAEEGTQKLINRQINIQINERMN